MGGLGLAARLAWAGYRVDVFEKNARAGGRADRLDIPHPDGRGVFRFDMGPTLLLMPEVYRELFASVGRKIEDYVRLVPMETNYRTHFEPTSRFPRPSHIDFTPNVPRMYEQLEAMERGAGARYFEFLRDGCRMYETSRRDFVGRNFFNPLEFFQPRNLGLLVKTKALRNMYRYVSGKFADPRLRAAFSFQTMYLGISPFAAPAVYALLPYTELANGIWFPMGGIYALIEAVQKLAEDLGARFHFNSPVRRVRLSDDGTRAVGVELEDGSTRSADAVIVNADLPYAYEKLLPDGKPRRLAKMKYTASGYMMYMGLNRRYPQALHHNVVFSGDYRRSFASIFDDLRVPERPNFYIAAPTRTDPSLAPEGCDILYILAPVPHLADGQDWEAEVPRIRRFVFAKLEELGFGDVRPHIVVESDLTPAGWQTRYNLDKGSAFGLSHNFTQVGWFRPSNKHPRYDRLYFVGASTQPGTGLPMVLLSAQLTAERILHEDGRLQRRIHQNKPGDYVLRPATG